ncbi:MAG: cell division protein FtsQ/DivIB, partial [Oscillospiraceae bacterium]
KAGAAAPASRPTAYDVPRGPRAPQGGSLRGAGVPPLNAFDGLSRRKAPNLPGKPGYTETEQAPVNAGEKKAAQPPAARHKNTATAPQKAKATGNISPQQKLQKSKADSVAFFLAAVVVCVLFLGAIMLKIEKFELKGESPYTLEEVTAAFGHEAGENLLFSFNAKEEAQKIEQALPYIEEIRIRRRPLNTVVFEVTQAQEAYYLPWESGFAVLSKTRKVLRLADTEPDGLIRLDGIVEATVEVGKPLVIADAETEQALNLLLASLEPWGMENINKINVENLLQIYFVWQNRFKVVVGSKASLDAKLAYVSVLLTDTSQTKFTEADRGTLDVSGYPGVPNAVYSAGEI